MENRRKIMPGEAAPYPATAEAEIESKSIFMSLLNSKFIKGEPNVLDKYPNSDGVLDITDANQLPVGKIEIQLKTLQPRNYKKPSYQCDKTFFSYCESTPLPVILLAVNRQEKKVYWRHIDEKTITEIAGKITGETCSITLPIENCIDGVNDDYIASWTELARSTVDKVWNFDYLTEQKKDLENKLADFTKQSRAPENIPLESLKRLHDYLDKYNYILDVEFYSVKAILYPNYWKIGMGILNFENGYFQYVLYPIEYTKEQTLIREIPFDKNDIFNEMSKGNILVLAHSSVNADIMKYPFQKAYSNLEDELKRAITKYDFPIKNIFLAQEYLMSFIDRFCNYLTLEAGQQNYSIAEVTFKLYSVLPMLAATELTFAKGLTECDFGIDSYSFRKKSDIHEKKIHNCIKKIEEGFVPRVKVTITSQIYNMDLIAYYINYLQRIGQNFIYRQYSSPQHNDEIHGVNFKKTWYKEVLWHNIQIFFRHFFDIYEAYVSEHFSYLKRDLEIARKDHSIIILFISDETKGGPYLEIYSLRSYLPEKGRTYIYYDTDDRNPINREKFFLKDQYDCILEGKGYQIVRMRVRELNFMFDPSPLYAFIKQNLTEKIGEFFKSKKEIRPDPPDFMFLTT